MVLKIGISSKLVLVCAVVLLGSSLVVSTVMAQSSTNAEAPFIGFRPFGGGQSVSAGASAVNVQSQSTPRTTITPEQPTLAYPYPASGSPAYGAVSSSQTGTAERASLGGRLPSTTTPTGSLNRATNSTIGQSSGGQVAGAGNVDPALWQRYQQELQQQQASQQYQQYQQWLAQQQQYRSQQQAGSVGYRSQQAPTPAAPRPVAQKLPDTRSNATNTNTARRTTAKLNQAVVQQVSSTTTSNRDSSVARADWSSTSTSTVAAKNSSTSNGTSVAKQASSVANSVAKPQCCCVPQNCCVAPAVARTAAPTTPAPVFRPQAVNSFAGQAANQVPTLNPNVGSAPNVASTYGGFLGQAGANYQVQPQGGYQFQSGLGVPQFQSTGTAGRGGWFSNGLFGTGAYTPLLPLVSAQGARLGQGIIGQPTAYMDGQPLRNLLRYLSP